MPQQFMLLESNPQLGLKDGIYQDTNEIFRDTKLSNYIQIAVAEVFAQAQDKSLFSLEKRIQFWIFLRTLVASHTSLPTK